MFPILSLLAMTDYSYDYSSSSELSGGALAAIIAFMSAWFLFGLILAIVVLIGGWKVFEKAKKPGWAVLIPIYNIWVLLEIVGRPAWWLILFFVPFLNVIASIVVALDLAKAFRKDVLFAILGLMLFSPIGILILGFGDAKYHGPQPVDLGLDGSTAEAEVVHSHKSKSAPKSKKKT